MKDLSKYLVNHLTKEINLVGPLWTKPTDLKEPILYIDGGAHFKKDKGISLGDNDSSKVQLDHIIPTEKDLSDLAYALSFCDQFTKINLFGFLGKRRDHELCNLGEAYKTLKRNCSLEINFENQILGFSKGTKTHQIKGLFSILSLEKIELSIQGDCKYKADNISVSPLSSHTLSNIGEGMITITATGPYFLFLN